MNFKTMLPMLVHLANTDSGANIRLSQWRALEATLGPVDSMAWDAYQDQEYATSIAGWQMYRASATPMTCWFIWSDRW